MTLSQVTIILQYLLRVTQFYIFAVLLFSLLYIYWIVETPGWALEGFFRALCYLDDGIVAVEDEVAAFEPVRVWAGLEPNALGPIQTSKIARLNLSCSKVWVISVPEVQTLKSQLVQGYLEGLGDS